MQKPKKDKKSFSIENKLNESGNQKIFSNRQEKKVAKKINAIPTVQSGSRLFDPADIRLTDYVIELKSVLKSKQVIVNEDMLEKILSESARVGKSPMIMLNFPNSKKLRKKIWILVPFKGK